MSNEKKILSHDEKVQALQYLFDLARQAAAPAAVHAQAAVYAQAIADSFVSIPVPAKEPASLADVIEAAKARIANAQTPPTAEARAIEVPPAPVAPPNAP